MIIRIVDGEAVLSMGIHSKSTLTSTGGCRIGLVSNRMRKNQLPDQFIRNLFG
jgi:hypothetical protein